MIVGNRLAAQRSFPQLHLLLPQPEKALFTKPLVGGVGAGNLPPQGLFHITPGQRRAVSVGEPCNTETEAR